MAIPLKNLYNEEYISLLAKIVYKHHKGFSKEKFKNAIFDAEWKKRELKSRMHHISQTLGVFLTGNYHNDIKILISTFKDINYSFKLENMIFQDYVATFGLEDFELSMSALGEFTVNSSSEFAIREFLLKYEKQTLQQMSIWAQSDCEHLRRLASEGCRPRLPWAKALPAFKKNPQPILEILEQLKNDTSPYVRKSVANNLNDISKENPRSVIGLSKRWLDENTNTQSLLKHGCRTLLKSGNKEVLEIFGFLQKQNIKIKNLLYTQAIKRDEHFFFAFDLVSSQELGLLRVEFAIHFLRKNRQHNKKVFQLVQKEYATEQMSFEKSYSFKHITTRTYYEGTQKLSIIVNGEVLKEVEFTLLP